MRESDSPTRDLMIGTETMIIDGDERGAIAPTRPPRCRVTMVTDSRGTVRHVTVC